MEYHCLESDFGSTLVQIENNRSLPKVYTANLLNVWTRCQKLGTHKTITTQNREENSRKYRRRGKEWRCLVWVEAAGE